MKKLGRLLLYPSLILICTSSIFASQTDDGNCDIGNILPTVVHSKGLIKGSIELTVKNSSEKLYFMFCNEIGRPLNDDYEVNKIRNLSKGIYLCFVIGSNGCNSKVVIEIK